MEASYRYAYVHGFASSPLSRKGLHLRQVFGEAGIEMELPDLNAPSFETMTYSSILDAMDSLDAEGGGNLRWRLIGSSMGGYLTARWAQLRPRRIDRVVLLCPGFDMATRWPELIGEEAMRGWERDGHLMLPDAEGRPRPVGWELMADAGRHPPFPDLPCPGLILHGTRDEIVEPESSRRYARRRTGVELIELDDDHSLAASLDRVGSEALAFFGLDSGPLEADNVGEGFESKGG